MINPVHIDQEELKSDKIIYCQFSTIPVLFLVFINIERVFYCIINYWKDSSPHSPAAKKNIFFTEWRQVCIDPPPPTSHDVTPAGRSTPLRARRILWTAPCRYSFLPTRHSAPCTSAPESTLSGRYSLLSFRHFTPTPPSAATPTSLPSSPLPLPILQRFLVFCWQGPFSHYVRKNMGGNGVINALRNDFTHKFH